MTIAAALALLSALGFAFSTSLQHLAAGDVPSNVSHPVMVLLRLVRHPRWIVGSIFGLLAFTLHAVALNFGTLSLVQPIILLGVVLAVVVRSALERRLPASSELRGVIVTVIALTFIVSAADTREVQGSADIHAKTVAVIAIPLVAISIAAMANLLHRQRLAAGLIGCAAGLLFGVTAALMKVVGQTASDQGVSGTLTSWWLWAFLALSFIAMSLNQRAYQLSRLVDSMPVLNVTSVLVSMTLGVVVFGEIFPVDPWVNALQVLGFVGIVWGLRHIASGSGDDASNATAGASEV